MFSFNVLMNGICRAAEGVSDQDYADMLRGEAGRMMLESVTLEEIESTYLYGREPMFEAITTTNTRVDRTMAAFQRQLNRQLTGTGLEASTAEIGSPRVAGGFATLTARFPISDGQAVSIIFHSPSGDPQKIVEDDTLVAFRFLMNKRDITNVVAPAGGRDISLKLVTTKLSNLLERNTEKFQQRNADIKAQNDELEALQAAVEATTKAIDDKVQEDAALTSAATEASADMQAQQQVLSNLEARVQGMRDYLATLKADAAAAKAEAEAEEEAKAKAKAEEEAKAGGGAMFSREMDTRGYAFAITDHSGEGIYTSGSNPKLAAPSKAFTLGHLMDLTDRHNGVLYLGGYTDAIADDGEARILGLSWSEIKALQQGQRLPSAVKAKMPKDAIKVYDSAEAKAKANELPENFISDKIKELVRNLSLAGFQDHATQNLGMNAAEAEQLYNDARKQLEAEHAAKDAATIATDPTNKLMADIEAALKPLLPNGEVELRPDAKYPIVKVPMNGGTQKLDITAFRGDRDYSLTVNFYHDTNRGGSQGVAYLRIPLAYSAEDIQRVAKEAAANYEQRTAKHVDSTGLPEYGSRAGERMNPKDIAKELRQTIADAKKSGKLPSGLKVSVTSPSSGYMGAIRVKLVELGDGVSLYSEDYLKFLTKKATDPESVNDDVDRWGNYDRVKYSPDAVAVKGWIDSHVYAHYWDNSDPIADYYSYAFSWFGTEIASDESKLSAELENYQMSETAKRAGNIKPFDYDAVIAIAKAMASSEFVNYMAKEHGTSEKDALAIWNTASTPAVKPVDTGATDTGASKPSTSDEPEGSVWYGLRARPFDFGAVPTGQIKLLTIEEAAARWPNLKGTPHIRHGAILYPSMLQPSVVKQFELVDNLDAANAINAPELKDFNPDSVESQAIRYSLMDHYGDIQRSDVERMVRNAKEKDGKNKLRNWIQDAIKASDMFINRKSDPELWQSVHDLQESLLKTPELLFAMLQDFMTDDAPAETKPTGTGNTGGKPSAKQAAIDALTAALSSNEYSVLKAAYDGLLDVVEADGTEDDYADLFDAAEARFVTILEAK